MARVAFPSEEEIVVATAIASPPTEVTVEDERPTDPSLFAWAMESERPADHEDQRGV